LNTVSRTIIISVVAALAIGAGWLVGQQQRTATQPPELSHGTMFPEPRNIKPFQLIDQDGTQFSLERFRDHWTFVYLGYTFCPDVCPATLAELGRVNKALRQDSSNQDVQYLFVSVDPNRDTPARLKQYVGYFGEDFLGATGDSESLEKFASSIGQLFKVPAQPEDDNYLVDHSSVVALFDPSARLYAVFNSPHGADQIEADFRSIRKYFDG